MSQDATGKIPMGMINGKASTRKGINDKQGVGKCSL